MTYSDKHTIETLHPACGGFRVTGHGIPSLRSRTSLSEAKNLFLPYSCQLAHFFPTPAMMIQMEIPIADTSRMTAKKLAILASDE